MTKRKTKPKKPQPAKVDQENKEAIAEALKNAKALPFGKRAWRLFLRILFLISLSFFAVVFGAVALVVLPIALPVAYMSSAIKGDKIRI